MYDDVQVEELEQELRISEIAIGIAIKELYPELIDRPIEGASIMWETHRLKKKAKQYLDDLRNNRTNKYRPTIVHPILKEGDINGSNN